MALKASSGWKPVDQYHMVHESGDATICRNTVNGEYVYILFVNAKAKHPERCCLGPFKSAEEADKEWIAWKAGQVKEKAR